jgi:hypothetical protein
VAPDRQRQAFEEQVKTMAGYLGWDQAKVEAEVAAAYPGSSIVTLPVEKHMEFLGLLNKQMEAEAKQVAGT